MMPVISLSRLEVFRFDWAYLYLSPSAAIKKLHKLGCKARGIYSFAVLETSPKSRSQKGFVASNGSREESSLTLPERKSEVAQSCPTLCDPMDCSPRGSSVH